MRNVVRAVSYCLVAILLTAVAGTLPAAATDKHIIVSKDADYAGFDLGAPIKGVDLNACQAACLANNACQAFTFNNKAGWCFLKSDFGALAAAPGATAGRVITAASFSPTLEKRRLGELDFLPGRLIDEARALIGDFKKRYANSKASYRGARDTGSVAYKASKYDDAALAFGNALAIADEDVNAWFDFAIASLARNPDDYSTRQQAWQDGSRRRDQHVPAGGERFRPGGIARHPRRRAGEAGKLEARHSRLSREPRDQRGRGGARHL